MGAFSKIFVAAVAVGGRLAVADDSDKCRDAHKDEATCKTDTACSWCKSAAVPSSCNSKENAKQLPPAVFDCSGFDGAFESFKVEHGKAYGPSQDEHLMRKAIFEANLKKVLAHNKEYEAGKHTWYMAMNHLADHTPEEFQRLRATKKGEGWGNSRQVQLTATAKANVTNPASVDWRSKNVVTPVKNQGGCGSCWAFSATEVFESAVAIQTGSLLTLSPQQLVSCAPNPDECGGSGGCQGSTQWLAFNYTIAAGGMTSEAQYPYTATTGTCEEKGRTTVAGIKGYVRLPKNDYKSLMNAVATIGPVAISVSAGWGSYSGGVFTGDCGTVIDHAVVLEGYGTENGKDYYLVRNSWGTGWGEGGYIKILRHDDDSTNCATDNQPSTGTACKPYPKTEKVCGLCGLLSDSSYPTGAHVLK